MKINGFTFQPHVRLEFTEAEIDILRILCLHHYDATVRSLVPPGRGAVINALLNSIRDGVAEISLVMAEVQLLCKACEMAAYPGPGNRELGWDIYRGLHKVIARISEEWLRVNPDV